ncbi:unnamed protein product [Gongylonema pulchrum]|uniref:Protein kinase domain-containing protein n=1 Tax=Gongylonema pulchrum TaxID=637853 RepID=A0A183DNL6_9BILA|nr:unnamed protein product [Gongylonema pulchrum]
MFDFITNPKMSLHSRIKRKTAKPTDIRFFDVGPNSSCLVYKFIASGSFVACSKQLLKNSARLTSLSVQPQTANNIILLQLNFFVFWSAYCLY